MNTDDLDYLAGMNDRNAVSNIEFKDLYLRALNDQWWQIRRDLRERKDYFLAEKTNLLLRAAVATHQKRKELRSKVKNRKLPTFTTMVTVAREVREELKTDLPIEVYLHHAPFKRFAICPSENVVRCFINFGKTPSERKVRLTARVKNFTENMPSVKKCYHHLRVWPDGRVTKAPLGHPGKGKEERHGRQENSNAVSVRGPVATEQAEAPHGKTGASERVGELHQDRTTPKGSAEKGDLTRTLG